MDRPSRDDPEQGPRVVLRLSDTPGAAERAMYEREGAVVVLEGRRTADTSLLIDAGAPNPPGGLEAGVVAARRDLAAGRNLLAVIEGVDPTWERSEADQLRLATLVRRTRRAVDLACWLDPRRHRGRRRGAAVSIQLLKGSDPVLLEDAAVEAIRDVLGDRDRSEVLEEFRGDEYEIGEMVLAASTISMFGERVVVARNMGRFAAAELAPVLEMLDDPPSEVAVVLVWDRPTTTGAWANPVPKKVSDAVKAAGGKVIDTSAPSGKGRDGWYREQFSAAPVDLDPRAQALVRETLGDDVGRLPALLNLLAAANTGGGTLGEADVSPYLGEGGGVPPWDLTDAIDKGNAAQAVELTRRMVGAGGRHPLQVMVTLQTHFERMLRLDGAGVRSDKDAAALLGMKGSTYPAKKAMAQGNKLGSRKLARATQLLATADVELRGATGTPPEAVLELLVARLASLGRR